MKSVIINKLVFTCWMTFAILVFFSSLKEQIVVNKYIQKQIGSVFPEGWGFFTKNPRDFFLEVYTIENNKLNLIPMSTHSNSSRFGLSRTPRVIGYEASIISNDIPNKFWKECKSNEVLSHIDDSTFTVKRKKHFNHFIKGEYLLKIYRKVPYAWANKNQDKYNPCKIVKIKIK